MTSLPQHLMDRQNDVFGEQLYHCGLLAAAFHAKFGSVQMRCLSFGDRMAVHEATPGKQGEPVEPSIWKMRADLYWKVCDIPPDECFVVTRYNADYTGSVGFERKSAHQRELPGVAS